MRVQTYAERQEWPLKGVQATVSYERVPAETGPDSEATIFLEVKLCPHRRHRP